MDKRIAEILLYVVDHLKRGESIKRIKGSLLEKGHPSEETDLALSYLLYATEAHSDLPREAKSNGPRGIRVLHEAERFALSPEAYGYLLKLRELNLITAFQMERVVDEILVSADETAGVEEVKAVVARLLLDESLLEDLPYAEEEAETQH